MSLTTRHIPMEILCIEQNKDVCMHSSPYIDTEIDQDLNAIPFQDVIYALNNAYPYGTNKRLALVWRALARTARRMKHSSTNLTSTYYLECAKMLDMERYGHYSMEQIVSGEAEKDYKRKLQQTNMLFYMGGKQ